MGRGFMSLHVVMGVSGCGKSTVAKALAGRLGGIFLDGDDFHPPDNLRKMGSGIPLTDEDRWHWLESINRELRNFPRETAPVFLACSALREVYRQRLRHGIPALCFIYLRASKSELERRLRERTNHFMPPQLLDSQLATLEEPADAITIDVGQPLEIVLDAIESELKSGPSRLL